MSERETDLDTLPTRVYYALRRRGYTHRAQVARLSDDALLAVRNIGPEGLRLIRVSLPAVTPR